MSSSMLRRLTALVKAAAHPGAGPPPCCSPGVARATTDVEVAGLGRLASKQLEETQLELLKALASPLGGPEAAGHTYLVDASKLTLTSKKWDAKVDEALEKAGILLGLPGGTQLSAQLAGLAIHEAGQPSQLGGAQQGPDVVGTLAFFLPCAYQEGELLVTVGGETECIELSSKNASNSRVAVLRTGCEHELRPATAHRLSLVYDVTQAAGPPLPPLWNDPLGGLAALAREWAAAPDAPRALCIVLEGGLVKSEHPSCFEDGPSHFYKYKYGANTLQRGIAGLQPGDKALVQALVDACGQGAELEVCLAAISRTIFCSSSEHGDQAWGPDPRPKAGDRGDTFETFRATRYHPLVGAVPAVAPLPLRPSAVTVALSDWAAQRLVPARNPSYSDRPAAKADRQEPCWDEELMTKEYDLVGVLVWPAAKRGQLAG